MKLKDAALLYGKMGWKVFPILPGAKNPPLTKWGTTATSDATQITAWWNNNPRANIGFAAGQSEIAVLDIDTKDGRRGLQTLEALDLMDGHVLSPTRMQRTPSGGLQYFYRGALPTTQNVIGKHLWDDGISHIDTRGVGGAGGYCLLPPSETIANAAAHTKAGLYEWINGATFPIAPLDQWVVDACGIAAIGHNEAPQEAVVDEIDSNVEWFKYYLEHDAPIAVEGEGGEARTLAIAGIAKDHGLFEETALDLMFFSTWNDKCEPPWNDFDELKTKVHNAYEYLKGNAPGELTPQHELSEPPGPLKRHVGDDYQNKADPDDHKPDEPPPAPPPPPAPTTRDGRTDDFAADEAEAVQDNSDLFSDKPSSESRFDRAVERVKARDAKKLEREWSFAELCDEWVYITQMDRFLCEDSPTLILKTEQFDKRFAYCKPESKLKTVSSVMFNKIRGTIRKPMCPVFLPGESPGMLHNGYDYNLYRPSEVVAAQGDTTFWDEHLAYLWPDQKDRDLVLNWCGWLLQYISLKPKHALLLAGYVHGTGKSFIGDVLTHIIGDYNVTPVGSHELSSSFNKWALSSKLLKIEELDDVEKNIVKHTLHPIITQEELTINDKGISTFKSRNCFGIFAMTNEDAAIRLSSQDRRYLVVRTHAQPKSQHYYHDLYSILDDNEALGAIAHQLLMRDLGEYNAQARAPDTEAKSEMVQAGMSDLELWMSENAGVWPLSGRVLAVDDVIAQLPARLERMQRLSSHIMSILKHRFKGIPLGQCRLPDKTRKSLWVINGSGLSKIEGANYGAIYVKDRGNRGVKDQGTISEFDAAEE